MGSGSSKYTEHGECVIKRGGTPVQNYWLRHRAWHIYDRDGFLCRIENYDEGMLHGSMIYFDTTGKIIASTIFDHGKEIGPRTGIWSEYEQSIVSSAPPLYPQSQKFTKEIKNPSILCSFFL
jgi:antitoxin component YwqK of YwqJK toxin-antitoxin module